MSESSASTTWWSARTFILDYTNCDILGSDHTLLLCSALLEEAPARCNVLSCLLINCKEDGLPPSEMSSAPISTWPICRLSPFGAIGRKAPGGTLHPPSDFIKILKITQNTVCPHGQVPSSDTVRFHNKFLLVSALMIFCPIVLFSLLL